METKPCLDWLDSHSDRLASWRQFRLENTGLSAEQAVDAVINYYSKLPLSSISIDPYDHNQWGTIWEIINSNEYCEFSKALLYAYTLHYIGHPCAIAIGNTANSQNLICICNGQVLNLEYNKPVPASTVEFVEEKKWYTNELCT